MQLLDSTKTLQINPDFLAIDTRKKYNNNVITNKSASIMDFFFNTGLKYILSQFSCPWVL